MKTSVEPHGNPPDAHVSAQLLFGDVAAYVKELGFDSCAYKLSMPIPISRPVVLSFKSADCHSAPARPDRVADNSGGSGVHFKKNEMRFDWRNVTHSLQWCEQDNAPLQEVPWTWNFHARDAASGALSEFMVVQQCDRGGGPTPITIGEMVTAVLGAFTHERMVRLLVSTHLPEVLVKLTPREKEVLRWTAEGKTCYEVAKIISVSINTVLFHLKNVVTKLDATNKTQAAVKATALGLLR